MNNSASRWWRAAHGNWNCAWNRGLTIGALAILGDDTPNVAARILSYTIVDAVTNCVQGVMPAGTRIETATYLYFGMCHAEKASSILSTFLRGRRVSGFG